MHVARIPEARSRSFPAASQAYTREVFRDAFDGLVRSLGGDPNRLIDHARIDIPSMYGSDASEIYRAHARLLDTAAIELECPDFGLLLARQRNWRSIGPSAMVANFAPTVGDAIQDLIDYSEGSHTGVSDFQIAQVGPDLVRVSLDWTLTDLRFCRQLNEHAMALILAAIEALARTVVPVEQATFVHIRPVDVTGLKKTLGRNLVFEAPVNSITIPARIMRLPLSTESSLFRKYAIEFAMSQQIAAETSIEAKTKSRIRKLLATGQCTLQIVADDLSMNARTLQRHLAMAGYDFRSLLEETRRTLAADYVSETNLPFEHIASLLGYSDQSAFTKAFKRWFGIPPRRFASDDYRRFKLIK